MKFSLLHISPTKKNEQIQSLQFPNPLISSSAHAAEEKLSLPSESFELIEASHHSASGSRGSRSGSHNGTPRHDEMKAWVKSWEILGGMPLGMGSLDGKLDVRGGWFGCHKKRKWGG